MQPNEWQEDFTLVSRPVVLSKPFPVCTNSRNVKATSPLPDFTQPYILPSPVPFPIAYYLTPLNSAPSLAHKNHPNLDRFTLYLPSCELFYFYAQPCSLRALL